jgi:hypothetical protein
VRQLRGAGEVGPLCAAASGGGGLVGFLNPKSGEVFSGPVVTTKTGIVVTTQPARIPLGLLIAGKLLQGIVFLFYQLVRHWWATIPAFIIVYLWFAYDWHVTIAVLAVIAGLLTAWRRWHRVTFMTWLVYPYRARVRRLMLGRVWQTTMVTARLAVSIDGKLYVPVLRKVKSSRWQDVLTVRMVSGQIAADFARAAERIASPFGARMVKVSFAERTDEVQLHLLRGDPLTETVKSLPVPATPDFTALPMGVCEDGQPFTLRLFGNQLLGVGATGAGKGSIAWSFIRALSAGIASGAVRLWVFDPKGGMELAAGASLFDRFLCDEPADMASTLEQAVAELRARAKRLRGVTRQHEPSVKEPLTVIIIDELAALTAYADKQIKERIKQSLALILTQGRAVGFHVLALVQDPRKEVVPFRDLFTLRIGLRLNEAEQVDLVLGDGAYDRGAWCDRISEQTPGVGYVVLEGNPAPTRVRISYLDDADIALMASDYAPTQPVPVQHTVWTVNR